MTTVSLSPQPKKSSWNRVADIKTPKPTREFVGVYLSQAAVILKAGSQQTEKVLQRMTVLQRARVRAHTHTHTHTPPIWKQEWKRRYGKVGESKVGKPLWWSFGRADRIMFSLEGGYASQESEKENYSGVSKVC